MFLCGLLSSPLPPTAFLLSGSSSSPGAFMNDSGTSWMLNLMGVSNATAANVSCTCNCKRLTSLQSMEISEYTSCLLYDFMCRICQFSPPRAQNLPVAVSSRGGGGVVVVVVELCVTKKFASRCVCTFDAECVSVSTLSRLRCVSKFLLLQLPAFAANSRRKLREGDR